MNTPSTKNISMPVESAVAVEGITNVSVEMLVVPSQHLIPPGLSAVDDYTALESVTKWLESAPISDVDRAGIVDGISDGMAKMSAYKHIMAISRARRLARNQVWLDVVQDRLLDPVMNEAMRDKPYWWLAVGKFLQDMQESDTKYIMDMTKSHEEASLASARIAAEKKVVTPADSSAADLSKVAPHRRENLRKLMQALMEPTAAESS